MERNTAKQAIKKLCVCRRKLIYPPKKKEPKDYCKRKRQFFVHDPGSDEEIMWHEPYMRTLRREFSDESVACDSNFELPLKDIALPTTGVRIRHDVTLTAEQEAETEPVETEKGDPKGKMTLPWQDLLITETLRSTLEEPEACDSLVELPWGDLALEKPMVIRPPREDRTCAPEDVEIPWDEILVPENIVIEPEKKRRHPSSGRPPRTHADVKTRGGTSTWTTTCM